MIMIFLPPDLRIPVYIGFLGLIMELDDVEPSEITFQKKLFASQYSTLFFVTVRDKTCIMKVVSEGSSSHLPSD